MITKISRRVETGARKAGAGAPGGGAPESQEGLKPHLYQRHQYEHEAHDVESQEGLKPQHVVSLRAVVAVPQ